jgi:putative hydrolase of the HAD superfamily
VLLESPLRALLIDVGGPLIDESVDYDHTLQLIRRALASELGRDVGESEIESARDEAIHAWAPSFTKAVLWHFLQPNKELTQAIYLQAVDQICRYPEEIVLTDGVTEVLPLLAGKYVLALAGNQPSEVKERLQKAGVLKYFTSKLVSWDIGFHKPYTRFFIAVCERIDVPPESCCMIGDRLDNDIYPANVMGMRTIWIQAGPHAIQHPRIPEDVPDATVASISEIPGVLDEWDTHNR